MRYSSLLALCAFMLCLNVPEVRGEILAVHTDDIMTHTALLPKPVASDNTFSLAATWWLPDWQSSQKSRGSDDIGGGDIDGECETYGYVSECNAPKISGGIIYPISGLACHKSCSCSGNFQYTSSNCSGKYKLSGAFCDGKYSACVCKDEFRYDSSNCNGENKLSGEICNGKYNSCTLRPECTVSSKDCTYGCAEYNSCNRCISCNGNPDCDVSDKSCTYGCASYNSCSKCTSCKDNPDCSATAVSCDYGCASTNSCGICTSCSGNPDCDVADKSCDYGCAATNSCGKCTSCKSCTPSANETGCTYGTESCSDGCGGTRLCCKGHTHSYACLAGYQETNEWGSNADVYPKVCSCGEIAGNTLCYKGRHVHSFHCPVGSPYQEVNEWGDRAVTFPKYCDCGEKSSTLVCYRAPDCGSEFVYNCEKGGGTRPEWEGATCGGLSAYCKCPEGKHWNKATAQCEVNKYEFEICTGITAYHQLGTIGYLDGDVNINVYIDGKRAGTVYGPSLYNMPPHGGGDYWHPAEPRWVCKTFEVSGASTLMLEHHIFARGQDGGYSMCYAYQGVNFTWVNDNGRDDIQPQGSCEKWGMGDIGRFTINGYLTSSDDIWDGIDTIKVKIEIPYGAGDDYPCVYPSYSC